MLTGPQARVRRIFSASFAKPVNLHAHATANVTASVSVSAFASDPLCICFSPAKLRFSTTLAFGDLHAEMTS